MMVQETAQRMIAESVDLADSHPERLAAMTALWEAWRGAQ